MFSPLWMHILSPFLSWVVFWVFMHFKEPLFRSRVTWGGHLYFPNVLFLRGRPQVSFRQHQLLKLFCLPRQEILALLPSLAIAVVMSSCFCYWIAWCSFYGSKVTVISIESTQINYYSFHLSVRIWLYVLLFSISSIFMSCIFRSS